MPQSHTGYESPAAWGAGMLRVHGVRNSYNVLICGCHKVCPW